MLRKIEYAGGNQRSFACAADALAHLAECSISVRHVERVTERLGKERAARRDEQATLMKERKLRSTYKQPPAVAVVMLDAGKAQFRQEDAGPGVHGPRWGDVKTGCLQTYSDATYDLDPQPEPPAAFLDPARVERLCREMQKVRGGGGEEKRAESNKAGNKPIKKSRVGKTKKTQSKGSKGRRRKSRRLVRTVVATTQGTGEFGWLVSAEAMHRKFYAAKKRAVIGDGGNWIDPLTQMHFPDWIAILDFLHLLVHLFAASRLAYVHDAKAAWTLYGKMLRDAWSGKVDQAINTLKSHLRRLKIAHPAAPDTWRVVELTLAYVENNRERMDYPRYRKLGLPVSSSLVESLIKQINLRVKGTEQFWNDGGLEAVLQVRAAYLSQDDRAETFHDNRPRGPAVGQNRAKLLKATG